MFGGVKKKVAKAKDKKLKDKVGKAREEKSRKTSMFYFSIMIGP